MQNLLRSSPWALVVPGVAVLALAATWGRKPGDVVLALVAAFLAGAVLASQCRPLDGLVTIATILRDAIGCQVKSL